ncbi:DNA repair protein [Paenibacillus swuensis]|uniref:Non-homologous end joining protein Ku n=1 Tax=Paenibacillus swuensis TaxID=1178515 RepID=A0A172TLG3_9BACL|nr:Ku protein [Paenibacillus swuensis]ANE47878.1 DNA repair protein [Paenibacillus swuensis]
MQTVWKGAINFGLVNVPVKMFSSTQNNDVPMKLLHKKLSVPINYVRTCPKCEEDVEWSDIVRGYEYEPGHFVTFDKDELDKLASEDSREIKILSFANLDEIDPVYFQKTYYLAPNESGVHAYQLLAKALEETQKIGIANVTIRSKSSLAAIRVIDGYLAMATMHYAEEIRPLKQVPNLPELKDTNEKELEMAKSLIEQLTAEFNPAQYEDDYKERLMDAIEDKIHGKEVKFAPEEKQRNVIDLMDALKASLAQAQPSEQPVKKTSTRAKTNKTKKTSAAKPSKSPRAGAKSRSKKTGA